jgi:SAM-dependent methyltransferase
LIYGKDKDPLNTFIAGKTQTEASERYIQMLIKRIGTNGQILLVAPVDHCFSFLANKKGLKIVQHLTIREFEQTPNTEQSLDAIVFLYQLEKCHSLQKVLDKAYDLLRLGGTLFVITPSLDSVSARLFNNSWTEWRPENNYYFDKTTIYSLMWRYGFNQVEIDKDLRWYTLEHMFNRISNFPKTWITHIIDLTYHMLPSTLHDLYLRLPTSGLVMSAKKTKRRERPLLSIVLPVYNEGSTFPLLIEQLIAKQINGVDKELIIVESNSTDNSRDKVMQYRDHAGIKIVLQDKARGKGSAVREGFDHANGDIILIQDADLEYDLNDYDALLEPVVTLKRPFVLGSRHGGKWKMRHFSDQKTLSAYFNFGHIFFTALLNLLYDQKMKDPFTMFKIFRRDCLYNLKFECNRFDFDFELVIKLIRKGYVPLEIPVNYHSRSFKDGKKVDVFRDPPTWIKALFKYRFARITKD